MRYNGDVVAPGNGALIRPEEMIRDLRALVAMESKSGEMSALRSCADELARLGRRILGPTANLRLVDTADGPIVQWLIGRPPFRLAFVGHFDTVHPLGSAISFPFIVRDNVAKGLGTVDMKAGIVAMLYGIGEALRRDPQSVDGVLVHLCSDEELSSPSSRHVLADAVRKDGVRVALVYEGGGGPEGALYTSRKGGLWVDVAFHGHNAHASRPHEGCNALAAMLRYGYHSTKFADAVALTTVEPTCAASGTAMNTVPDRAVLTIDCRTASDAEQTRVLDDLTALGATVEEVRVAVSVRNRVPAMPEDRTLRLYALIRETAHSHGHGIIPQTAGFGISDANHLAGMGVAVIDGLGPVGGEDHSPREWVDLVSMHARACLTADLIPAVQTFARGGAG
jgi:glutamate carboxypeptidase